MPQIPPIPEGFEIVRPSRADRRDPWEILREEGWTASNGFRTDADTARIRAQGYRPASNSLHLDGDAVDLDHPRLSRGQQMRRLHELFGDWPGRRILDEGHHRHMQLPGWGAAPGTPGTPNSGMPPIPEGFELVQRGPLTPDNFITDPQPSEAAPAGAAPQPGRPGVLSDLLASAATGAVDTAISLPALPRPTASGVGMVQPAEPPQAPQARPNLPAELGRTRRDGEAPQQLPDDARVEMATRRDNPALAGVNQQVASMFADPNVTEAQIVQYLQTRGITPQSIQGFGAAMAWRRSPAFRQWLRLPASQRGAQTVNLDDQILPEGQQRPAVVSETPQRDIRRNGVIESRDPTVSERLGSSFGGLVDSVLGEGSGREVGQDMTAFLRDITPVGAYDLAREHSDRALRAQIEGRQLDSLGNQAMGSVAALGMIPMFGRARTAAEAATSTLAEAERLAGARLAAEGGQAADEQLARVISERFDELPEDVRRYLLARAEGQPVTAAHIADLRMEAAPRASLVERGAEAIGRVARHPRVREFVEDTSGSMPRPPRGGGEGIPEQSALETAQSRADEAQRRLDDFAAAPAPRRGWRRDAWDAENSRLRAEVEAAQAELRQLGQSPSSRAVDRIDVGNVRPGYTLEPQIGRVRPLGEQPSAEELADAARTIRPEDVQPIPYNRVDDLDEARRANPGTIRDVDAPDERTMLEVRSIVNSAGATVRYRGPLDAEAYLRTLGGLRDEGGELRHIGITNNKPRDGNRQEARLGRILNNQGGMSLDDAGEALHSAGYFRERPTTADVVDMLRQSRLGRSTWRLDDLGEVERFEGAQAQRFQAEQAAQAGRPIAEDVGEPAGFNDLDAMEPPAVAYEDLPRLGERVGNIDLNKIDSAEDVARLLHTVEERLGGFDAARRGRMSHADTRALALELGMTPDDLLRRRRGQALNAEQIDAARLIMAKSSDEVIRLAARAIGPEASDVSRSAFSEAILRHAAIHEQVTGAISEAGRSLQALRMAAQSRALSGRIHEAAVDGMGGQKRLEDIAEGILELQRQGAGPGDVNRFAVKALDPRFSDKLVELWYNSLLSGGQTHAVNVLSNTMTAMLQHPEFASAAALGHVRRLGRAALGKEDDFNRVMFSELGPRMYGMMQGAAEGARAFKQTLLTGEVTDFVTKVEARSQHAISGFKGSVIRTPTRLLAAEDEFFKAVARRMELNGLAVRQARKEGLRGDDLRTRIADLSANPTDEMVEQALDYARYLTFQQPLKGFPQSLSALTQRQPWMKLFLPFIRTPTNILKYAVARSPFAPILKDVRKDFVAGGARRDLAVARIALGTGLGLYISGLVADGTITGAPPRDRAERDLLEANGWQPYSIRVGDTYYSYQRLDPLAITLGTAADLSRIGQHFSADGVDPSAIGADFVGSILGNLSNKTWLSGVSDLIEVLNPSGGPAMQQGRLENFFARLGGSIAVPTGVAQFARWLDPVQRDTRADGIGASVVARIQSRLPWVSQSLPARRDIWGREMANEGGLGPDLVSPIWTRTARNDSITQAAIDAGARIGRPRNYVQVDGERIDLTPRQQADYQRLSGQYIREDMAQAITDPEWQASSRAERRDWIKQIVRDARADARADLNLYGDDEDGGSSDLPPIPPGFETAEAQ